MRVIQIVPTIAEEASGPSYSVVRLSEALIAQQQEVTLAALDWGPMVSPLSFLKTFPLGIGPRQLGRSPELRRWLIAETVTGQTDLIHSHGLWTMPNVYPAKACKRGHCSLVISPRGMLSAWALQWSARKKKIFWRLCQESALKAATCFHATAECEYEDIRQLGFKQPVCIVPNGIDVPPNQEKRWGNDKRRLLFLGRIHPKKGMDILLRAWQAVESRFPDWELQVVGPDNNGYLAEMQELAKRLQLKRVVFTGVLYGEEKLRAYREASLFVLPTYSENFGLTVGEALAVGTPAIVSRGAPWAGLESYGAGWWIEIGVEPLVICLEEALSCSTENLVEMGRRGRSWMEAEFSWGHIGRQMAETYRWLLDRSLPVPHCVRLD